MKHFDLVYANEMEHYIREHQALLVDVRERQEYEREHWRGAVNIPYDMISGDFARLPKNRTVLLYCEHGGGSMQLASRLGREGYSAATVVGGYEAMKKFQKNYFKNDRNV